MSEFINTLLSLISSNFFNKKSENEALEKFLDGRKVRHRFMVAAPDHDVRFFFHDRRCKALNIAALIGTVGVRADDDVGAEAQGVLQARRKRPRQPQMLGKSQNMVRPRRARRFRRFVFAAVVHNLKLHRVCAGKRPRQLRERRRDVFLFVIAGNLDNNFHRE